VSKGVIGDLSRTGDEIRIKCCEEFDMKVEWL